LVDAADSTVGGVEKTEGAGLTAATGLIAAFTRRFNSSALAVTSSDSSVSLSMSSRGQRPNISLSKLENNLAFPSSAPQ